MTQQADGFVYVQTNDADHNQVVVFARRAGGELDPKKPQPELNPTTRLLT